jgi:hypothetical protein
MAAFVDMRNIAIDSTMIETGTVAAANSIDWGTACHYDRDTGEVTSCADKTAVATHIAFAKNKTGAWPCTAGEKVTMIKIGSDAVVPAKVLAATGNATVGLMAVATTGGAATDYAAETGTPDTNRVCYSLGRWWRDGAAGDLCGLDLASGGPFPEFYDAS